MLALPELAVAPPLLRLWPQPTMDWTGPTARRIKHQRQLVQPQELLFWLLEELQLMAQPCSWSRGDTSGRSQAIVVQALSSVRKCGIREAQLHSWVPELSCLVDVQAPATIETAEEVDGQETQLEHNKSRHL